MFVSVTTASFLFWKSRSTVPTKSSCSRFCCLRPRLLLCNKRAVLPVPGLPAAAAAGGMNVRRSTIDLRTTPPLSSRKRSGLSRNSTRYVLRRNPTREVLSFCRRVTTTKCSCSRPTVSSHSSLNRPPLTSSTHSLSLRCGAVLLPHPRGLSELWRSGLFRPILCYCVIV